MTKYDASADPNNQDDAKRKAIEARLIERRRWRELQEVAARCAEISEKIWGDRLDKAAAEQEALAVKMRDRAFLAVTDESPFEMVGEIPVPLLTPRDRLQFLKEFTTTLLISADRRNLPATPEAKREPETPEAAAGVAEVADDEEVTALADAGRP